MRFTRKKVYCYRDEWHVIVTHELDFVAARSVSYRIDDEFGNRLKERTYWKDGY